LPTPSKGGFFVLDGVIVGKQKERKKSHHNNFSALFYLSFFTSGQAVIYNPFIGFGYIF